MFEHDGEVVLGPRSTLSTDPLLPLRAAVVAARNNLPIAPTTLANLAGQPPAARGALAGDRPRPVRGPARHRPRPDRRCGRAWTRPGSSTAGSPSGPPCARARSAAPCTATPSTATSSRPWSWPAAWCAGCSRADLLLLAALLHDIGKVPGAHDHSATGAPLARAIATRLGYPAADVDIVTTLVREHLTLIDLATRRDHQDPRTVDRGPPGGRWRRGRSSTSSSPSPRPTPPPPGRRPGPTGAPPCCASSPTPPGPGSGGRDRAPRPQRAPPSRRRTSSRGRRGRAPRHRPAAGRLLPHRRLRPGPAGTVRRHRGPARGIRAGRPHRDPAHGRRGRRQRVARGDARAPNRPTSERIVRGLERLAQGDRGPLGLLDRRAPVRGPAELARPAPGRPVRPVRWSSRTPPTRRRSSRCGPRTAPGCSTSSA